MGKKKDNSLTGIFSFIANRTFAETCSQFGFDVSQGYALLDKEFKRLNNGRSVRKFVAREWYEFAREENPELSGYRVVFKYLPEFENIIYGKSKDKMGKDWKEEFEYCLEERSSVKAYHNRINKCYKTINEIDEKRFKDWQKKTSSKNFKKLIESYLLK